jgi:hypothetical protein
LPGDGFPNLSLLFLSLGIDTIPNSVIVTPLDSATHPVKPTPNKDNTTMMTFTQWQATGRDVDNLPELIGAEPEYMSAKGRMYHAGAYIEQCEDGEYMLTIGNDSRKSADLREHEAMLYLWCCTECPNDMGIDSATHGAICELWDKAGDDLPNAVAAGEFDGESFAGFNAQELSIITSQRTDTDAEADDAIAGLTEWCDQFRQVSDESRSYGPQA